MAFETENFSILGRAPQPNMAKWWITEAEKWQDKIPEAKALLEKVCE
jgi:hypothetical protein